MLTIFDQSLNYQKTSQIQKKICGTNKFIFSISLKILDLVVNLPKTKFTIILLLFKINLYTYFELTIIYLRVVNVINIK